MADNLSVTTNDGATTIAADDVSGTLVQRVKVQHGADGSATDTSAAAPLPARLYDGGSAPLTSSARGTANDKLALDVALPSKVETLSITAGSGTRTFGPIDTLNYMWWTAAFTAVGSAPGNLVLEGSHDNTNWFTIPYELINSSGLVSTGTSSSLYFSILLGNTFTAPLTFRYLRAKTTGTVTGQYDLLVILTSTTLAKQNIQVLGTATPGDQTLAVQALGTVSYNMRYAGYGLGWNQMRTPTIFKTVTTQASGSTALWTPTSGRKFRLMKYKLDIPNSTIAASPGDLDIAFYDSGTTTAIVETVAIPSSAMGGMGAWTSGWVDLENGILSAAANNVLNINLSFALTGGTVRVIVAGVEE